MSLDSEYWVSDELVLEEAGETPSTLRHAPLYAPRRTPMALGVALALADAAGHVYAVWDESKHPRDEDGQWTTVGGSFDLSAHGIAQEIYKVAKGTDPKNNQALLSAVGIKVSAPESLRETMQRAMAHVVENRVLAKELVGTHVQVVSLPGAYGRSKGLSIYVDESSVRSKGAGYAATIIRHELEHKILTAKKIPSSEQERKVLYTAGLWAAMKSGYMAKTNPVDAEGFKRAAKDQGIKV